MKQVRSDLFRLFISTVLKQYREFQNLLKQGNNNY